MLKNTGDKEFFERLYYKTCFDVRKYLRTRCDSYQDIEDVMQETYYEVLTHFEMVRESHNPEGYVMNVVKYKYMKYRADRRRKEANGELDEINEEPVFTDNSIEDMETWDFVKKNLKYKDYLIVRLRYGDHDSIKIISEKLNITEAACKMRLKRSLQKLQKAYKK